MKKLGPSPLYPPIQLPKYERGTVVVALDGEDGKRSILARCKYSMQPEEPVGPPAVREIVAYRGICQSQYTLLFDLAVVTNAFAFDKTAEELAAVNGVRLITREKLSEWLNDYPVNQTEILLQ